MDKIFDVSHFNFSCFLTSKLQAVRFTKKDLSGLHNQQLDAKQANDLILFLFKNLDLKKAEYTFYLIYQEKFIHRFFELSINIQADFFCVSDYQCQIKKIQKSSEKHSYIMQYMNVFKEKHLLETTLLNPKKETSLKLKI